MRKKELEKLEEGKGGGGNGCRRIEAEEGERDARGTALPLTSLIL